MLRRLVVLVVVALAAVPIEAAEQADRHIDSLQLRQDPSGTQVLYVPLDSQARLPYLGPTSDTMNPDARFVVARSGSPMRRGA